MEADIAVHRAALAGFEESFRANPHDGPTQICLARVRHYMDKPPDDAWDGVFVMETK